MCATLRLQREIERRRGITHITPLPGETRQGKGQARGTDCNPINQWDVLWTMPMIPEVPGTPMVATREKETWAKKSKKKHVKREEALLERPR